MYDWFFYLGVVGAVILVMGAAAVDRKVGHPARSLKNRLLVAGGVFMLTYSILSYLNGGSVFFVFLQGLVNVASILLMLDVKDKVSVPILIVLAFALVVWSFYLSQDYATTLFILGLTGIALGYAMETATLRRNMALLLGSVLIALFSYLEKSWIFFWLNVFFAIFSAYYVWKFWMLKKRSPGLS